MPDTIPPPAVEATPTDVGADFEEWAKTSAKLLRRSIADRASVLRHSGFANTWAEIDSHWYERLVQDLDAGRRDRLDAYMEICHREMIERGEQGHDVLSPLDVIGGPLDAPAPTLEEDDGSDIEKTATNGIALTSVTPPLGASSGSIEIDLDLADLDDEDDEQAALARGDTRVSAVIPEAD